MPFLPAGGRVPRSGGHRPRHGGRVWPVLRLCDPLRGRRLRPPAADVRDRAAGARAAVGPGQVDGRQEQLRQRERDRQRQTERERERGTVCVDADTPL